MIEFEFEEIPLLAAPGQPIALISGTAAIRYSQVIDDHGPRGVSRRSWEWDIEDVALSPPLLGYPDVKVPYASILWPMVTASITAACGDAIYDALTEANQPDPDAKREAMLCP